ncbi:PAS domain S-box protein [Anabaena azotica]|uniref:histidine kinase n=1 Tax=Anabaena azotica FACHB-119 TaxID=947527 RepID=A0ABR8D3S0_9NOST|nr:PAS domain S-box protein [Anabaena azotica]MBD2500902.1 PAS domain S-box protein [Anabaena azotica FACHB-119]
MRLVSKTSVTSVSSYTVLIVENVSADRELYRRCLLSDPKCCYTLLEAHSATDAMLMCQNKQVDGILVNYGLPDVMGLKFVQELQTRFDGTHPPIVMVSSDSDPSIAVRAIKLGAEDYLIKQTLIPEQLQLSMRSAIENARLRLDLQHQEERFRISIENMLDCFGICCAIRDHTGQILDFRIDYLNAAALKTHQMSADDIGKSLCELFPAYRETGLFEECCRVVEKGAALVKEELIYADVLGTQGLTHAYDIRVNKLDDGLVLSWRDVTDYKRSQLECKRIEAELSKREEVLNLFVKYAPAGVAMFDRQMQYVLVSDRWLTSYGLEGEDIVGRSHYEIFPEVPEQWQQIYQSCLAGAIAACEEDVLPRADGSIDWVRWEIHPWYTDTSEIGGIIVFSEVISDVFDELRLRKLAEDRLRESQVRCHTIAQAVPSLLFETDAAGANTWTSQQWCKFTGQTQQQARGQGWAEVIHPQDLALNLEQWHQSLQNSIPFEVKQRLRRFDGEYIWFLVRALPMRDQENNVVSWVGAATDINDIILAKTALEERESTIGQQLAELESIYATAPVGLCFLDSNLCHVRINERLAQINGVSVADHLGRTAREFIPELAHILEPLHQQVMQTGEPILNIEIHGTTKAQPTTEQDWIASYYPLKDATGQVLGINVMVQDISDRKRYEQQLQESERRWQLGMQVAGIALARVDYITNTVQLSPEAAVLYGLSPEQLVVTRDRFHATFHPEECVIMSELIEQLFDPQGTGWFTHEHRVVWDNGEVRWLNVRKQVFFEHFGDSLRPSYAILAALDVTERKQAQIEREQLLAQAQAARAEAEAANRSKDEFVALIAHELRSPLNAITGWTQLLQTRQLDAATTKKALETILRNTQAQVQLIEDLFDVSRMVRGTLQLDFALVNLVDIVETAVETVRPTSEAKSLQIETQLQDVAPVWGDFSRLQQVILNLLTNSIKFTPTGGHLQIRLNEYNSQVRIQVSDTGQGIRPEFLPHIFERFRQDQHNVTVKQGLGLGLALVKYIIEQHGGTVTAESLGEGQGSTFTVLLPLPQQD